MIYSIHQTIVSLCQPCLAGFDARALSLLQWRMQENTPLRNRALTAWRSTVYPATPHAPHFVAHSQPCFLVLLDMGSPRTIAQLAVHQHAQDAHNWVHCAPVKQTCLSATPVSHQSLWDCCAAACVGSKSHIFLNLDLLTIDPHAQDWGDFKIKPEQVEVQRNELSHSALFLPRTGYVFQVLKSAMPAFNELLRQAQLASCSTEIGKTWGSCEPGAAVLDVYRDAKKQMTFSASELLALHDLNAPQGAHSPLSH